MINLKTIKKILTRLTLSSLVIIALSSSNSFASVVKSIKIVGNERYNGEMIKASIPFTIGDTVEAKDLNNALKTLNKSKLFSKVSIDDNGGNIVINVVEADLIKKFTIEGNDGVGTDTLKENMTMKNMMPYSKAEIAKNVDTMLEVYSAMGYYSATVVPMQIPVSKGVYNIVFKVNEGSVAKIDKILFEGNFFYTDKDLANVVKSREWKWWAFFSKTDVFDENRFKSDVSTLMKYYKDAGFIDIKIIPLSAKASRTKNDFILTYKIDEGTRYKVRNSVINTSVVNVDLAKLKKQEILTKDGEWYSEDLKDKSTSNLSTRIEDEGFSFKEVTPEIKKVGDGLIDIDYNIKNGAKIFVNKINIIGNTVTKDSVIRNQLYIGEQDTLTQTKLKLSKTNLANTGFFKGVSLNPSPTGQKDKFDINVAVEEQNTGEVSFSVGWSTLNGILLELGLTENNFMGKGTQLATKVSTSTLVDSASLSYTDPTYFNKNMSGGFDLFATNYKYRDNYGYDMMSYGAAVRTGWNWTRRLNQSLKFMVKKDDVYNLAPDSHISAEDAGKSTLYITSQNLTYQNSNVNLLNKTRSGYVLNFSNDYTLPISTENYFKTDASAKYYKTFFHDRVSATASINGGYVEPLKDNYLKRQYRYFLGGATLRGFDISGVGARIPGNTYTEGGLWRMYGTFELKFPIGIPREYKVSGLAFLDYGSIGKPSGYDPSYMEYSSKLRTAIGWGVLWDSPMGAISLTWAYAQQYEAYDQRQVFRLSVGNTF